jgi:hypothetical protein
MTRILLELGQALVIALAMVGCVEPAPSTPVESPPGATDGIGTDLPSLPVPDTSLKPSRPSPTIEVPPPID